MLELQISYSGEYIGIFRFNKISYFCEYLKNLFEKMGKSKTCIMKHLYFLITKKKMLELQTS